MLHTDLMALQGVNTGPHVSETSLFLFGTSGKLWLFYYTCVFILYGNMNFLNSLNSATDIWAAQAQRAIRGGSPSWAGRRLPSPADAGHVRVKLTGEAAARSPFQEGGPDGWLK